MESRHGTLAAATVTTITFSENHSVVEVINRSGTADIFFTVDTDTNPTVGGDDTYVLPATRCSFELVSQPKTTTQVRLISSGTPTYSVVAW